MDSSAYPRLSAQAVLLVLESQLAFFVHSAGKWGISRNQKTTWDANRSIILPLSTHCNSWRWWHWKVNNCMPWVQYLQHLNGKVDFLLFCWSQANLWYTHSKKKSSNLLRLCKILKDLHFHMFFSSFALSLEQMDRSFFDYISRCWLSAQATSSFG